MNDGNLIIEFKKVVEDNFEDFISNLVEDDLLIEIIENKDLVICLVVFEFLLNFEVFLL